MKRFLSIGMTLSLVAMMSGAWAQAPRTISYQGVLTDGLGTAVADGNYSIVFRLYDVSSGGSAFWTEAQGSVPVAGGIFNTTLGSVVALTAAFDATYWLTVSVAGGPETTPRREFVSVPYAINAYAVQGSTNVFPANGNVGVGTTSPSAPLEVHFDNTGMTVPAIVIDNDSPGGQDIMDFRNSGNGGARIRYAAGGGMHIGTLPGLPLTFRTGDTSRMTIGGVDGDVLIGSAGTAAEKLDVDGAVRLGTTLNSNAGTMRWTGTDFEGYDGTTWKSLTGGGGGTLPPGTANQTLQHDGANWTATSFLFNTGNRIGVGTTTPEATLHVAGGQSDLGLTEGDFKIGDSTNRLKFGVGTSGPEMGTASIRAAGSVNSTLVLGAGSADVLWIGSTGVVDVGSSTQDGELNVRRSGSALPVVAVTGTVDGGSVRLSDEAGNAVAFLEPDSNGEGGRFNVRRNRTSTGFFVEGNDNGTGDPTGGWVGASRSAQFHMAVSGNGSVTFPVDAISNTEMLDEPGVASETLDLGLALSGGLETIVTRSITAPAAGYALVTATIELKVTHTNGVFSSATFGVSDNSISFPANQDVGFQIPLTAPTGVYIQPLTVQGLFTVGSAGAQSFYLLAFLANGAFSVADVQFTVVYFATAYGTVTPTLVSAGGDSDRQVSRLNTSDLAAERAQAAAFHRARIDNELSAMRAELDALREELAGRQ